MPLWRSWLWYPTPSRGNAPHRGAFTAESHSELLTEPSPHDTYEMASDGQREDE